MQYIRYYFGNVDFTFGLSVGIHFQSLKMKFVMIIFIRIAVEISKMISDGI